MNEARGPIELVLLFQQNPFSNCLSLHGDLHDIISLNDTMNVIDSECWNHTNNKLHCPLMSNNSIIQWPYNSLK